MKKILILIAMLSIVMINVGTTFAGTPLGPGFKSADGYGINSATEERVNKLLNKVSVQIINSGGKEGYVYKTLTTKLEKISNELSQDKANYSKVQLIEYIQSYLDEGINIFPIIEKEDKRYNKVLEEFVGRRMRILSSRITNREEEDIETVKRNEQLFIDLFKERKLPILHTFSVGGNDIFVTSAYKNTHSVEGSTDCGYYSAGILVDYESLCVAIIKDGNNYSVVSGEFIYMSSPNWEGESVKIIDDRYILSSHGRWDTCYGRGFRRLLDKNLNRLKEIHDIKSGCYSNKQEYAVDGISFGFYKARYNGGEKNKNYPFSYKIFTEKEQQRKFPIFNSIKEYGITKETEMSFDIEKNLLSAYDAGIISFSIGDKEYEYTLQELNNKDDTFQEDIFNSGILSLYKNGSDYVIKGKTHIWQGFNFENIQILSCINNSQTYDSSYYELNSFISGSKDFTYNISEKYGNKCTIPYKIKFTKKDGEIIEKEFSIEY